MTFGGFDERPVAFGVTELVVDALEAVQIDEQHGNRLLVPPCERQLLLAVHEEPAAVVEARQVVGQRLRFELRRRACAARARASARAGAPDSPPGP